MKTMKKLMMLMLSMLAIVNCSAGTKDNDSNNNEVKMEKILFINGSPNRDGNRTNSERRDQDFLGLSRVVSEEGKANTAALAKVLLEGRQYETLNLNDYRLNFYGQTLEGDQLDEVIAKIKEADIIVMGSPVY